MSNEKKCMIWLWTCAAMVFAMAIIGAITRLKESGLSMVEWRPLLGALPPLSTEEWQRVFSIYQESPEYLKKNMGMSLEEFKGIFFWEWFHRLWGRLIGLVFMLPLIWFWIKKQIPQGYGLKFLGLLILGGLQGVMGWYMVKSGLVDRPSVSHYRLAAHLGLAFLIFALLAKTALSLSPKSIPSALLPKASPNAALATLCFILTSITIIWGAFTAGLDAGLIYNSFPLMGGHFFPSDAGALSPFYMNFIESHAGVQFFHRWVAVTTALCVLVYAWQTRYALLGFLIFMQIGLGIGTLLSNVHLHTATAHQGGAFLVLLGLVLSLHKQEGRLLTEK